MEKIKGYRELSEEELNLINEAKIKAEEIRELLEKISSTKSADHRWLNIAKTDLQKGFMFLTRAIAQPTTF